MSNVYKALRQAELENESQAKYQSPGLPPQFPSMAAEGVSWLEDSPILRPTPRPESRLVVFADHSSIAGEKFRVLRTRLHHLQDKQELKTVLITSAAPGEGKTMVASNLALSLARNTSQRVLLLEGDLRHPAMAGQFGLRNERGITDWFETDQSLTGFVYRIESLRLWCLSAGVPAPDPLRILQSARFADAINQLVPVFDWVVIDAPPLLPLADVHVLSAYADGLVLVVRQGKASKKELVKGLSGLDGVKVVGVVMNDVDTRVGYYDQYYAYGHQESKKAPKNGSGRKGA